MTECLTSGVMAESRGFEPLTRTGSALSGRLPRPTGRSPLIGGSLGQRIDHRLENGGWIATATPYATRRVVVPSNATVVAVPPIEEPRVATFLRARIASDVRVLHSMAAWTPHESGERAVTVAAELGSSIDAQFHHIGTRADMGPIMQFRNWRPRAELNRFPCRTRCNAHVSYSAVMRMEAPVGVEPTPRCLRNSRSAFELRSRFVVPSPSMPESVAR